MKKYLSIFFVAFMAMFSVGLLFACSSDDDDPEYGRYYADGPNAMSMMACDGINAALWSAFGSDIVHKRDDSKAIKIFDENTAKVRNVELIQSITLKFQPSSSDASTSKPAVTIKTQTFPF